MISLFNKKSIATTALALSLLLVLGCSSTPNKSDTNLNSTKVKNETYPQSNIGTTSENSTTLSKNTTKNDENNSKSTNKSEDNNKSSQASTKKYGDTSKEKPLSSDNNVKDKVYSEQNITEKIKNYIINGQENTPEAQKIKWSKTFLNRVDIENLYKKYISNGGHPDDVENFANYMTLNAPIPSDWQELFKKDLYDTYGEKVVRFEHLKDDLYQAYIEKAGSEIPYVVVSSRTGYFHG